MKLFKRSLFLTLAVLAMTAITVLAVAPNVTSVSGSSIPVVNGNDSEWTTSPGPTNADWFSSMCSPASTSCAWGIHDLFLRFDCSASTLYILVLATNGGSFQTGAPANNWVTMGSGVGVVVVNQGSPYTDAGTTAPPIWRDVVTDTHGYRGYEAAINLDNNAAALVPGQTYSMNFQFARSDTAKYSTGTINVTLPGCAPTAVTVSGLSAQPADGGLSRAEIALGGIGAAMLGGLVVLAARKH